MFASDFDAQVVPPRCIPLDDDVLSTVDVDAAGVSAAVVGPAVCDAVTVADAVPCDIGAGRWAYPFAADEIDSDIVNVVDIVAGDSKVMNIPVQRQRLAVAQPGSRRFRYR